MRTSKSIIIFLSLVSFLSCSTQSDEDGNSTTAVVPVAPSNLTGTVASSTQINLSWSDNSTNESGFKIERKTGSNTYAVIGTTTADITNYSDTGLLPSTAYTYRVYSYNSVGKSLTYSNDFSLNTTSGTSTAVLPTITMPSTSSITNVSAVSGGNVTSDGGAPIIARGVCWNVSGSNGPPTIALSTKTTDGTGVGNFTSLVTGLNPNTSYNIRAYATNSVGTAYSESYYGFMTLQEPPVVSGPVIYDIDNNSYQSVKVCDQTFTIKNLNVSKYSDGTPIPQVTDDTQWANLTTGAWCYYINSNGIYEKMYNWYAVAGIYDAASLANPALRKKLAPAGWHIPSIAEWTDLANCLYGVDVAGGKMKSIGTVWNGTNVAATNSSNFNGLPGGVRDYSGWFYNARVSGFWWSSNENSGILLRIDSGSVDIMNTLNKKMGGYVRCFKD